LSAERAGFESDREARVDVVSTEGRGVGDRSDVPMGADGALNGTHLDRNLDYARPTPVEGDAVEAALAKALEGATAAGRFDVVALLAGELQARRLAREGVPTLRAKPRQGGT
jgi:hypothetical protein